MIKFENTVVSGFEAAIRGCRNPMNSWDKSDSGWSWYSHDEYTRIVNDDLFEIIDERNRNENGLDLYTIGPSDMKMMTRLIKAGTDEAKFMRYIDVTVDIVAPLYWWKEFDTYKVGTVANSCSTMHKIHEKEFTVDDFSHEHLCWTKSYDLFHDTIDVLNYYREKYLEHKDKDYWWQMIQLLPSSYNQRRTVKLNYQVLRAMYFARRNHKLDEWREGFCEWVESLPYSELITMNGKYEDLVNRHADLMKQYHELELKCNELLEERNALDSALDQEIKDYDELKEINKNLNDEVDRLRDMLAEEHNENIAIREQLTEIYDEYLAAGVDKEFRYVD